MVALPEKFDTRTSPFKDMADALLMNGYTPIPIMPRDKMPAEYTNGHWTLMSGWNQYAKRKPDEFTLKRWKEWPDANVGIVLGTMCAGYQLIALDFDTENPDELDLLQSMVPMSPMSKRGARGYTAFYRAPADLRTKRYMIDDPSLPGPNKRRTILEVLTGNAPRQTVMPPSIHPSGNAYEWRSQVGIEPLGRLPILTSDHMEQLEDTLEHMGWNRQITETRKPSAAARSIDDGTDPWREVNELALQNLDAWVPALGLPHMRKRGAGYECVATWRASGTGQEEHKRKKNLKFHVDGIKDMGTDDGYTPIDVICAWWSWQSEDAFVWLQKKLGLDTDIKITNLPKVIREDEEGNVYDSFTGEILVEAPPKRPGEMTSEEPIENVAVVEGLPLPSAGKGRIGEAGTPKTEDLPDYLTRPPGLLGDLTDWIEATANTPNRVIAFGAALASLSTILGRKYASPTRCGTALYILCLGLSGCGKQHGLDSLVRILREAKAEQTIGSPEAMSATALVKQLQEQPLSCSPVDEFSQYMKRINSRRAASHEEAIKKVMLSVWGSNYNSYMTPSWAGKASETVFAPSLTILGMSTPAAFYAALEGSDVENGMLNRFLILKTDVVNRQRGRKVPSREMSEELKDRLCALYLYDEGALGDQNRQKADWEVTPIMLRWSDEVGESYADFVDDVHRIINAKSSLAPFYARTAEMALRIATIQSLSRDPEALEISAEDLAYGKEVAKWSAASMARQATLYMADTSTQAETNRILQLIIHAGGKVEHGKLMRLLKNRLKVKEVREYIMALRESGAICEGTKIVEDGGEPKTIYWVPKNDA